MCTPIIIKYTLASFRGNVDNLAEIINALQGNQRCSAYYYEPYKGTKKRIKLYFKGKRCFVIATLNTTNNILEYPFFKNIDSEPIQPMSESIDCDAFILFSDRRDLNTYDLLQQNGLSGNYSLLYKFIKDCSYLQKPIIPEVVERDKEIWIAYCNGLNELQKNKREFIKISRIAGPYSLYQSEKSGVTLYVDKRRDEELIQIIEKEFSEHEGLGAKLSDNGENFYVNFDSSEDLTDSELERIDSILEENGFAHADVFISKKIKSTICLNDIKERPEFIELFDKELEKKGFSCNHDADLLYRLESEEAVPSFLSIFEETFKGQSVQAEKSNKYKVSHDIDKSIDLDLIRLELSTSPGIKINSKSIVITAESKDEYEHLRSVLNTTLRAHNYSEKFRGDYHPLYSISTNWSDDWIPEIDNKLSKLKKDFSILDSSDEKVIRLEYAFHSPEERERIKASIKDILDEYGTKFKLVTKKEAGIIQLHYKKDKALIEEYEQNLNNTSKGEDVKLVVTKIFNDTFKDFDPDYSGDSHMRNEYYGFLNDCHIIGKCKNRTTEFIQIELSEDFYNGDRFVQSIYPGDMVFFPSIGTSAELGRQLEAVNRIDKPNKKVNGKRISPPVNQLLPRFLFNPTYAGDINSSDLSNLKRKVYDTRMDENLNDKQIEAIAKAILAPDISFIQGPPGTGKTTVIAEIIWQIIKEKPDSRILLTSQTNLAVDNALERLKYKRSIRPVRIGSENYNNSEDKLFNPNILSNWVENPEVGKGNAVDLWIDEIIKRIDSLPRNTMVQGWRNYLFQKDKSTREFFVNQYLHNVNLIAATCSVCGGKAFHEAYSKLYGDDANMYFDLIIIDEASKATPLEMAVPMVLGKKIVVIGDHKQLPPMMDNDTIDTALRAIGRKDLADKIVDIKESQFKKLFMMAQQQRPNIVSTLDTQYRMHKQIMKTITHFYYDDTRGIGLICGIEDTMDKDDFTVKGSRYHGINCPPFVTPSKHAIWVNVPGNEERVGTSYKNQSEIDAVRTVVKALTSADGFKTYINSQTRQEDKEIGIITFYSPQRSALRELRDNGELNLNYDYRIEVVDRFQGMERNIIIVSTVRSNDYGRIGFAKEIERINVAFSRARSLLIVVGNRELFNKHDNYKQSIDMMWSVDIEQIEDKLRQEYGRTD